MTKSVKRCGLGELKRGAKAVIVSIDAGHLTNRFLEMGFVEGDEIEVLHEAPFRKNPIAVRVRGSLIALRREEANCITVGVSS